MSGDGVEYFGLADAEVPRPSAEACASLARWLGTSAVEARGLLERNAAAGAIETRGSWKCGGCGAAKRFKSEYCQCNWPGSDSATRNERMPWDLMDGAEALAITRRRFTVPL